MNEHRYFATGSDSDDTALYWYYSCGHTQVRRTTFPSDVCSDCGTGRLDESLYLVRRTCECGQHVFYPERDAPDTVKHTWRGHQPRPLTEGAAP